MVSHPSQREPCQLIQILTVHSHPDYTRSEARIACLEWVFSLVCFLKREWTHFTSLYSSVIITKMHVTKKTKLNIRTSKGFFDIILETWNDELGYVVRVPVFPEIVTQGNTFSEAKNMAREAIELCLVCEANGNHPDIKSKRRSSVAVAARV